MEYLWVGLGSALGGMSRHWIAVVSLNRFGAAFPWGTYLVNVVGSFTIGLIAVWAAQGRSPFALVPVQRFLLVGLLGGFTTFSSFSLQTWQLYEKGQTSLALLNAVGSLLSCLVAVALGMRLARVLAG